MEKPEDPPLPELGAKVRVVFGQYAGLTGTVAEFDGSPHFIWVELNDEKELVRMLHCDQVERILQS